MSQGRADCSAAIIGAGAAGASLAVVLARQGIRTALIDPRPPCAQDFRAEKFTPAQWDLVRLLELDETLAAITSFEPCVWVARRGRLVEKCRSGNRNYRYPDLVEALRGAARAEPGVEFISERVAEIATSEGEQRLTLSGGRVLAARLAVLATGVGCGLAKNLGFERRLIFAHHSISVGFDCIPVGRPRFDFPALTYFGENPADGMAYLSLFPIGAAMRANLFVYRNPDDPWLERMKSEPEAALRELAPGLERRIGPWRAAAPPALRPVDLFRMANVYRAGVVLIGDSFGTACPASGSGLNKVFSDVARLNAHLPEWLATPGMSAEKIACFYADPQKRAADASSLERSRKLRELSTRKNLPWRLRRDIGFLAQAARGGLRSALHFEPSDTVAAGSR